MNAKEALAEIKKLLFSEQEEKKANFSLVEGKLVDGTVVNYNLETAEIYVVGPDGVSVPAPVGEHQLETGEVLIVKEEGKIDSIKEQEKPQEEAGGEPMAKDAPADAPADAPKEDAPKADEAMAKFEEAVASLSAKVDSLAAQVEDMKKKYDSMSAAVKLSAQIIEELANQPSGDAIQKPNTFYKEVKSEKTQRFNDLQKAFQKLKTK